MRRMGWTVLRVLAVAAALMTLLWVLSINNADRVEAGEDQPGLTFNWVGGEPPQFVCVGDTLDFMFVLRYNPPDTALAPLVPGALDVQVTLGSVSTSHWPLDLNTKPYVAGGFTYTSAKEGIENLLVTYYFGIYQGSVPVRFRVQKCDYRVKIKLQRDSTLKFSGGQATGESHATLNGEGGFHLRTDRSSRGGQFVSGRGAIDVLIRGAMQGSAASVTNIKPGTGTGTFQIIGEVLPDGSLELDFMMGPVTLAGDTNVLTAAGRSITGTVDPHKWYADSKNFWSVPFPPEGGEKSLSKPPFDNLPPGATITEQVDITVTRGGAQ